MEAELIQNQLTLIQQSMDKYDNYCQTIRNWTITIWAATISTGSIEGIEITPWWALIVISILIVFAMWMYDGIYKSYRENYKKTRDELVKQINNNSYNSKIITFPVQLKGSDLMLDAIRLSTELHVGFLYGLLIIISAVMLVFRLFPH